MCWKLQEFNITLFALFSIYIQTSALSFFCLEFKSFEIVILSLTDYKKDFWRKNRLVTFLHLVENTNLR